MVNRADRERCHVCGRWVYIAPSADPYRRVVCARCAEPEDVEDEPLPDLDEMPDGLEDTGQDLPHRFQSIPKPKT